MDGSAVIRTKLVALIGLFAFAIVGCGSDGGSQSNGSEAPSKKQYTELLAHDWTLAPGVETYFCIYQTLTEDLWITDFRPLSPAGTHHATLGFSDPGPVDGVAASTDSNTETPCNGLTLGTNLAFAALVGTDELAMPEGVAVKIPAGKQLLASLHLFNTTDASLSGRSGVQVVNAQASEVVHEAEVVFVHDPFSLSVPPGKSVHTTACTMVDDVTVFAVLHHMHETGVHMTTTAMPASGSAIPLVDQPYEFDQQKYVVFDPPVSLQKGDKVQVACSYENPGPTTLAFGESTNKAEMCIAATYRYPAVAASLDSTSGPARSTNAATSMRLRERSFARVCMQ